MSLLSSTVNDEDEFIEEDKENNRGCSSAGNAPPLKLCSNGGSGGGQQPRRHWKLFSSSSDDALQQCSVGIQKSQRGTHTQQQQHSHPHHHQLGQRSGGRLIPGAVFAASPDRILLPLGSSPVLNARNCTPNSARNGTSNGLRDVEPLLAASPNILGSSGGKSGPRGIHSKTNGLPLGSVLCLAYTPPNRYFVLF